jgi:hypothetical protein
MTTSLPFLSVSSSCHSNEPRWLSVNWLEEGWTTVHFPTEVYIIIFLTTVLQGSGALQASNISPGVKRPQREPDHSFTLTPNSFSHKNNPDVNNEAVHSLSARHAIIGRLVCVCQPGARYARYCTLSEVRDYWQNKLDGDAQYIRNWSLYMGRLVLPPPIILILMNNIRITLKAGLSPFRRCIQATGRSLQTLLYSHCIFHPADVTKRAK